MAQDKDGLGQEGSWISAGMGMAASPGCPNHPKPAEKGQIWAQIQQLEPGAVSLLCLCVNKPKYCSSCAQNWPWSTKTIVFHLVGAAKFTLGAIKAQPNKHDPEWDPWLWQAHPQPAQTAPDEEHFPQIPPFNSFP